MYPTFEDTIKRIFFQAAQAGYAGDALKTTITELPGSKIITFVENEWLVKDVYFVNDISGMSFGTKTIWHLGKAVWYMTYNGWYENTAISFLKKVLARSYAAQDFQGGRGSEMEDEEYRMVYTNKLTLNGFRRFSGVEEIWDFDQKQLGVHRYEGRLLIDRR